MRNTQIYDRADINLHDLRNQRSGGRFGGPAALQGAFFVSPVTFEASCERAVWLENDDHRGHPTHAYVQVIRGKKHTAIALFGLDSVAAADAAFRDRFLAHQRDA
jgi:hypothetical protein